MKALGMIEVYSFTTAVCVADIAAKAAEVAVIAMDRNRPIRTDVPAPLVMIVKIEGEVSAVRAAVEAGVAYAKDKGKYIVSHIIPNPGVGVEKMAYRLDINKDKFNKKLPKNLLGVQIEAQPHEAFGLVEVEGLVAAVNSLDAMLKTSAVKVIHSEKRLGGRLVTFIITGSVSAVKAAVENGCKTASQLGKVFGCEVIPSPHDEIVKFFDLTV